jgi:hypothetical protein
MLDLQCQKLEHPFVSFARQYTATETGWCGEKRP